MDELTNITQHSQPTMSSREIAELCDKRHDNVLKLIRELIEGGILKFTTPQEYVHPQNGQVYTEYLSDKRDSLVIVARLSPEFTAAVIDRWQQLEQATAPRLPTTYLEALRALADEVEAREKLEQQLALAEPKVEYFDALVNRNLLLNFTTVAKELGVKRKVLIGYLLENNYIYRDANNNLLPYSQHTPHLFEVKEYTKDNYAGVQTLVTPRGRETLRLLLSGLPSV